MLQTKATTDVIDIIASRITGEPWGYP
jgi:hypothetical protein